MDKNIKKELHRKACKISWKKHWIWFALSAALLTVVLIYSSVIVGGKPVPDIIASITIGLAIISIFGITASITYILTSMDKYETALKNAYQELYCDSDPEGQGFITLAEFFIGNKNMAFTKILNTSGKLSPEQVSIIVYAIIANNLDREGKTNHE